MTGNENAYSTEPFQRIRKATVDLLTAAKRKNMIHSLIEVDITRAIETLKRIKKEIKAFIFKRVWYGKHISGDGNR